MIKISFLGDVVLNGIYNDLYKRNENPFSQLEGIFSDSDLVLGNLECTAEASSENLKKKPRLKTKLETLNYLKTIGIGAVSLANNHSFDNLDEGIALTTEFLDKNGIKYFGAGYDTTRITEPLVISKSGIKVAILNYVTNDTNPNLPIKSNYQLNFFDIYKANEKIKSCKKKYNYVVVYIHWGGKTEGGYFPDLIQRKWANEMIKAGADLIVGNHAHTLQPYEEIKNKFVFYSLGNFCYSDYFSDGKFKRLHRKRRTKSIILKITFSNSDIITEYITIKNKEGYIHLDQKIEDEFRNRNNLFKIFFSKKIFWHFYYIYHKFYIPFEYLFLDEGVKLSQSFSKIKFSKLLKFLKKNL